MDLLHLVSHFKGRHILDELRDLQKNGRVIVKSVVGGWSSAEQIEDGIGTGIGS